MAERFDAVVVGCRCAGSATATALARAGRSVLALDRGRFPSDTLSTHLLFLGGVVELQRLGALERVQRLGAPRLTEGSMGWGPHEVRAGYTPVEGLDYALCVRRPGLDAALVDTAREAGAHVRERATVSALVLDGSRVAGVRYRDRDGGEREVRAPLVVGADGRRSVVARSVGAERPELESANGRGCYFAYWRDRESGPRSVASQWRQGEELVTAFPCDDGLVLVLVMPPLARAREFADDLAGEYERTVAAVPALAERLRGAERQSKVRHTVSTASYFRRSHGPGWALAGDAGHFKDPVTAQGIRDALRFGRLLGERAAPVLDDPRALDRVLGGWERTRDRECLQMYQWTNRLGRAEQMGAVEGELYRRATTDPVLARQVLDVMARTRSPASVLTPARKLSLAMAAARRGPEARRAVAGETWQEFRDGMAERGERLRFGLRRVSGRAGAGARSGPVPRRPRAALDAG
ncbi:MAG TPA: NAD(P)/FAD-dependent oxidoreductase [Thermoleophilaceae bacterium]|nr:NAD(P)/FAD-dependent oxidoreductase [Thermoleophilaceae bacterium]